MKLIDISGQRFGRLYVSERFTDCKKTSWICVCDCGRRTVVNGSNLKSGRTRSCGCLEIESRIKHGLQSTPEYRSWQAMHGRCYNPTTNKWEHYGGRGIQVCARWHKGTPSALLNFVADMGKRPYGMTLDRINSDGHYMPSNCRWATLKEQRANRRYTPKHYRKLPQD